MMICRSHRGSPFRLRDGYTFLEIALALAIIAVLAVAAVPLVSAGYQERQLRNGMESLEQFVREVRLQAEVSGQEMELILQPNGLGVRQGGQIVPGRNLPRGVALLVRHAQTGWVAAQNQSWRIFSAGLVTPLSLRLEQGTAWLEADFDFLTGNILTERYSF